MDKVAVGIVAAGYRTRRNVMDCGICGRPTWIDWKMLNEWHLIASKPLNLAGG